MVKKTNRTLRSTTLKGKIAAGKTTLEDNKSRGALVKLNCVRDWKLHGIVFLIGKAKHFNSDLCLFRSLFSFTFKNFLIFMLMMHSKYFSVPPSPRHPEHRKKDENWQLNLSSPARMEMFSGNNISRMEQEFIEIEIVP